MPSPPRKRPIAACSSTRPKSRSVSIFPQGTPRSNKRSPEAPAPLRLQDLPGSSLAGNAAKISQPKSRRPRTATSCRAAAAAPGIAPRQLVLFHGDGPFAVHSPPEKAACASISLLHRLIPIAVLSSKVPLTESVRKERVKVCTPESPPSADDSPLDLAALEIFPHRARAEAQHVGCFAQCEQAVSNRRRVSLFLSFFHPVVPLRVPTSDTICGIHKPQPNGVNP